MGQVKNDIDYITVWHEYPLTSSDIETAKVFNHRLQVSTDGKVWFTLYDSKYQQNGGYKEYKNGKTYYINDTLINDNFTSVQQNIAGINTTIQNVEKNLKTEIEESANGFNVNIQKISQDLENAKSALNNAIDALNTSFNVELGKITGLMSLSYYNNSATITFCGDYNTYLQTCKIMQHNGFSISGETFTWDETSGQYKFMSNTVYDWIAIGS